MWIFFALSASFFWGLTYVLSEQVYKKISVLTSLTISNLVTCLVFLLLAAVGGFLKKDLNTLYASKSLLSLMAAETTVAMLAALCIGFSISAKNATLSGLIEISYPIFIALFSYLLYKKNEVTPSVLVGGALIFIGVLIIYRFNK